MKTVARSQKLRTAIGEVWRTIARDLLQPYRPELHYMRGPGPKCLAKHAQPQPEAPALQLAEHTA